MNCKLLYETISIQRWLAEDQRTKNCKKTKGRPITTGLEQPSLVTTWNNGHEEFWIWLGWRATTTGPHSRDRDLLSGTASRRQMTCSGVTNTGSGDLRTRPEAVGFTTVVSCVRPRSRF